MTQAALTGLKKAQVKIHLIIGRSATPICSTRQRNAGFQVVRTEREFKMLSKGDQCEKCAARLRIV